MTRWTNGFVILLFLTAQVFGQKAPTAGGGGGSTTTTTGGANTPTSNPVYNNPNLNNNTNNNPSNDPFATQPIFLSGKVMFDDGSPMNKDVRIERVCGANVRIESHVDNSGHFSFEIGGNTGASESIMDASQSDSGGSSRVSGLQNQGSLMNGTNSSNNNSRRISPEQSLWGCELRASYPGYRSESLSLAGRKSLDDPNVGTIILHRLANVQGTTISITTAEAPKSAQKNYDKGMQAARKNNMEEAEKRLLAATGEYPKYAIAWFALGQVQERLNRPEDARKSYLEAANADKHYVSPYDQLALLAAHDSKWADAAQYSKQAIDLNPVEFPASYWYNAVANYNLNRDADAIKSGKALVKLDTRHLFPEVNRMLAELSVNTKDYAAAAEYLKTYLAQVPAAKDAETLKQQLLKIEEAKAQIQK
jgi:tetratricopeptide (TPR) repeat protein